MGKWLYRIVKLHKQNKLKDESAKIVKGWGRIGNAEKEKEDITIARNRSDFYKKLVFDHI